MAWEDERGNTEEALLSKTQQLESGPTTLIGSARRRAAVEPER